MAYGDIVSSGTISGSSGGTTVTGSSTAWASGPLPLVAGDVLYAGGYCYPVTAVASDTSLTIGIPLQAAVSSGTAYQVVLAAPARQAPAQISSTLPDLVALLGFLVDSGLAVKCEGVNTNTPPGSPATGDYYAIGTSPTGAWAGNAGSIAKWTGSAWYIRAATIGDMAIDTATPDLFVRTASTWEARSLTSGAVRYDTAQSLSLSQQVQARTNIGAQFFSGLGLDISGLDLHNLTGNLSIYGGLMWGVGVTNAPDAGHWSYIKTAANGEVDYWTIFAVSWYQSATPIIMVKNKRPAVGGGNIYSAWKQVSFVA